MSAYQLELFGTFNNCDIHSIIDERGQHWFTQDVVAEALGVDRTTLAHMRQNHPSELREHSEYDKITYEGRRRVVFSEEGFFTVCDMAQSERAYRLRKWMRQQFRVKQKGDVLTVQSRVSNLPDEDWSDLGQDLMIMKEMLNAIADNRRRILSINQQQVLLEQEHAIAQRQLTEHEARLRTVEERLIIQPGEMTATQIAHRCGWTSKSGSPHNTAVILACLNEEFDAKGFLIRRHVEGPGGRQVEEWVLTPEGVTAFMSTIDTRVSSGQSFTLIPNEYAFSRGNKNKRHVFKR